MLWCFLVRRINDLLTIYLLIIINIIYIYIYIYIYIRVENTALGSIADVMSACVRAIRYVDSIRDVVDQQIDY